MGAGITDKGLANFNLDSPDYHELRKEVRENTYNIVEDQEYYPPDGRYVDLSFGNDYSELSDKLKPIRFKRSEKPAEVTVVPDDCLDAAHNWVKQGLSVCVLNMANRNTPRGGVRNGAGAQEEYLFRCSDYYRYLFKYSDFAHKYGLVSVKKHYPLDRNFGGVYAPLINVFRANEKSAYALLDEPWKVNFIAVAAMNWPDLEYVNGEERIVGRLIDGVKYKIRTVFRIAASNNQKNLILGAFGCGAFRNPPKHIAELFRDVLCEPEFCGAFDRI